MASGASQAAQGQQRDAARQRLAAVDRRCQPVRRELQPRDRLPVGPDGGAVHVALQRGLLPAPRTTRTNEEPDRDDLVRRPGRVPHRHQRAERSFGRGDGAGVPQSPEHLSQHGQAQADGDGLRLRRRGTPSRSASRAPRRGALRRPRHVRNRGQDLDGRVPRRPIARTTCPRSRRPRSRSSRSTTRRPGSSGRCVRQQGPARLLRRRRHAHVDGDRQRTRRRRRPDRRVPHQRRHVDGLHRAGRLHHRGHVHGRLSAPRTRSTTRPRSSRRRSASSRARAARSRARTSSTARR